MKCQKILLLPLVAVLFAWKVPAVHAQDAKAVKKVEDKNRAAMEDYDLLEFENAKKQLNEALVLIKKDKLDKHPVAARTHLNLGIVLGGGLGDADTALLELISALEIDQYLKLPDSYRTPELSKLFEQAKSTVSSTSGGTGSHGPEAGGDEEVTGLKHVLIDEAKGGASVRVTAKVGADVKASKVLLFYRRQGAEEFTPVVMKNKGGVNYEGDIPAGATSGESVHYYIEARNSAGKVAATNGNAGSPNIITLVHEKPSGGGSSSGDDGGEDEENPLGHQGGPSGGGSDDDGEETTISRRVERSATRLFFSVTGGTSGAYVRGQTEQRHRGVKCCYAWEPAHFGAELGFWITKSLALSGIVRMGVPYGANIDGHAPSAPAGFLRMSYAPGAGYSGLLLHGDVGFGTIRQIIPLDRQDKSDPEEVDIHTTGPLFVGGGLGYVLSMGGPLRLVIDGSIQVGIPVVDSLGRAVPQFGLNNDLSVGLALAF
ncbi:MAG: hypothetical protein HY698_10490 [Deltaproteobacteria bacterium]|nr:hypothetical protein [Deltaproteobacteria bacterium]